MSELKHEQSAASAIETTDLTRCFGDLTAVDHLNLTVNQGELFALL